MHRKREPPLDCCVAGCAGNLSYRLRVVARTAPETIPRDYEIYQASEIYQTCELHQACEIYRAL